MAFRGEFRNTSSGDNRQIFAATFEKLHQRFLNEDGNPSPEEDSALLNLFQQAYSNPVDYINSLFETSIRLSIEHGLTPPSMPKATLLDLKENPIAGMGSSFFERIVYLNKAVNNAYTQIDMAIESRTPTKLPALSLMMAVDIFDAIRIGSFNKVVTDKTRLSGDFKRAKNDEMQVGYVQSCKIISETHNGKFVHKKLANVLLETGKLIDLFIEGEDKGWVQAGSTIGVSGLKKSNGNTSLLVPHTVYQFLESCEKNFRSQRSVRNGKEEFLSDEHQGTLILGTITHYDPSHRKITLLDKDNKSHTVRLSGLLKDYDLNEGDTFIAHPNKLDKEGLYPRNVMKLDAPWVDRLQSGLPAITKNKPPILSDIAFAPTEQMPH